MPLFYSNPAPAVLRFRDQIVYSDDMTPTTGPDCARHLEFDRIAPGLSFHAALVLTHPRRPAATLHTHDFSEMVCVLQGTGTHWVNGESLPLSAGSLIWVRPRDCHTLCGQSGKLHFINIAFPLGAWRDFCRAAGLEGAAGEWEAAHDPLMVCVPEGDERAACARAFQGILHDFHERPTRLSLCRFWTQALPHLLPSEAAAGDTDDGLPPWLAVACAAMAAPDNLREGVGRMAQIAGVGMAHLARTLRAYRGQTPTEFLLELRLQRAAALLRTGAQEIGDIACDCGFENLSYFYRRFRERFGQTPRAYRHDPRHKVLPLR